VTAIIRGRSRPAIVSHEENGRWWVSFTDGTMPPQAPARPAQLKKRITQ
jgi:hypothetical protein